MHSIYVFSFLHVPKFEDSVPHGGCKNHGKVSKGSAIHIISMIQAFIWMILPSDIINNAQKWARCLLTPKQSRKAKSGKALFSPLGRLFYAVANAL